MMICCTQEETFIRTKPLMRRDVSNLQPLASGHDEKTQHSHPLRDGDSELMDCWCGQRVRV
jgi:hypothetical protein